MRRVLLIYSQFIANKPTPFAWRKKSHTHTIPLRMIQYVYTHGMKKKQTCEVHFAQLYRTLVNKSERCAKPHVEWIEIICDLIVHCSIKWDTFLMHSLFYTYKRTHNRNDQTRLNRIPKLGTEIQLDNVATNKWIEMESKQKKYNQMVFVLYHIRFRQ